MKGSVFVTTRFMFGFSFNGNLEPIKRKCCICGQDDCSKRIIKFKNNCYCERHYYQLKKFGKIISVSNLRKKLDIHKCCAPGCDRTDDKWTLVRKGDFVYCEKHYSQLKRHGDFIVLKNSKCRNVGSCVVCGESFGRMTKTDIGLMCGRHYAYYKKNGNIDYKDRKSFNKTIDNNDGTSYIVLYNGKGKASGKVVLVDTDDVEMLSKHKWSFSIGYAVSSDNIRMHRLIMGVDRESEMVVDHIDGDKLNNRRTNLRICTPQQNSWHKTKLPSNNSSGFIGVYYNRRKSKWSAEIVVNGVKHFLGNFCRKEDAIMARCDAENVYFGEYKNTI